jgi:hypothetical protein
MTPRERRLAADLGQMTELAAEGVVSFRTEGSPRVRTASSRCAVCIDATLTCTWTIRDGRR